MATNSTPNYQLPLVIDTDKPTWRGDFNQAMSKIDQAIKDVSNIGDDYDGRITLAQNTANAAQNAANDNKALFTAMGINGSSDATALKNDVAQAKSDSATALQSATNAQTTATSASEKADAAKESADAAMAGLASKVNKPAMEGQNGQALFTNGNGQTYWGDQSGYTLPKATASTLGGVKIGSGVSVSADGTISVDTSGGGGSLQPGSVTTEYLANDAVTADKIADGAVTSQQLASNAVSETKIADSSVTTQKIATGAVTSTQLSSNVTNDISKGKQAYDQFNTLAESVLASQENEYFYEPGMFTVAAWGPLVTIQLKGCRIENPSGPYTIGKIKSGYYPAREFVGLIKEATNGETGFMAIKENGDIVINITSSGTIDPVGSLTYLTNRS